MWHGKTSGCAKKRSKEQSRSRSKRPPGRPGVMRLLTRPSAYDTYKQNWKAEDEAEEYSIWVQAAWSEAVNEASR